MNRNLLVEIADIIPHNYNTTKSLIEDIDHENPHICYPCELKGYKRKCENKSCELCIIKALYHDKCAICNQLFIHIVYESYTFQGRYIPNWELGYSN